MAESLSSLQEKIVRQIGLDKNQMVFHFTVNKETVSLELRTRNPRHKQEFIYHIVKGVNKKDALEKMLVYATQKNKEENSYTIQWRKSGDLELHTSYFMGKNIYAVMDKFFSGKNMSNYTIFNISLNPVS